MSDYNDVRIPEGYTGKKCTDCRYAFGQDTGYSNYTVEGCDFTCIKDAHPQGTFDEFYGDNAKLMWADQCPEFKEGPGFHMDVDGKNSDTILQGIQLEVYREIQAMSLIAPEPHWLLTEYPDNK